MRSAVECRRKAEAMADLARMFPDRADTYREVELLWRELETQAAAAERQRLKSRPH
jgi:hypothetical protein